MRGRDSRVTARSARSRKRSATTSPSVSPPSPINTARSGSPVTVRAGWSTASRGSTTCWSRTRPADPHRRGAAGRNVSPEVRFGGDWRARLYWLCTVIELDALALPAESVAVALNVCAPTDSVKVTWYVAVVALVLMIVAWWPATTTAVGKPLAPAVRLPLTVVDVELSTAPLAGELMVGALIMSALARLPRLCAPEVTTFCLSANPRNAVPLSGTVSQHF